MSGYWSGLLLGLALIVPIGAQNVFVINQSIAAGMPRALAAVAAAAACDTLLILAGAAGVSTVLTTLPGLRPALLAGGSLFLLFLGVRTLRSAPQEDDTAGTGSLSLRGVVVTTVSVSLLNPHAILDTVGVLGAAIIAQEASTRPWFAGGAVTASWVWFLAIAVAASLASRLLTPARRMWIDRFSGLVLLAFAVVLAVEFIQTLGRSG